MPSVGECQPNDGRRHHGQGSQSCVGKSLQPAIPGLAPMKTVKIRVPHAPKLCGNSGIYLGKDLRTLLAHQSLLRLRSVRHRAAA